MRVLNSEVSISPSKSWGAVLALIIVAAIALRLHWASGFHPADGAEYARVAHEILKGTFDYARYNGVPIIPVRTGVVLPTLVSMALFGPSEVQLELYPLFMSVVMILLVYLFSARMFGHAAARIASIIWVFLPIEIDLATTLYPEVPATAFAFAGIYWIYIARSRAHVENRSKLLYGLLAGLAFGAAWLCKASVVYFVPFCLTLILLDFRKSRFREVRLWASVATGSLIVLLGEMLVYGISNGDWLYRFTAIQENYEQLPQFFFTEGAVFGYESGVPFWAAVIKRIIFDGPAMIFLSASFLFLPSIGTVAALRGLYRGDHRFYFMAGLLAVLIVMSNFSSASLEHYQPMPLFTRYFYPICVPAVILTGGMVADLVPWGHIRSVLHEHTESMFWGGVVIFLLGMQIGWSTFRQLRDDAGPWAAAEKYLAGTVLSPSDRIHTDALGRNALEFFWRYPDEMNISVYGEPGRQPAVRCNDYVLRNISYDHWLTIRPGMWLNFGGFEVPSAVTEPPKNWDIVWTNQNATLFKMVCQS